MIIHVFSLSSFMTIESVKLLMMAAEELIINKAFHLPWFEVITQELVNFKVIFILFIYYFIYLFLMFFRGCPIRYRKLVYQLVACPPISWSTS